MTVLKRLRGNRVDAPLPIMIQFVLRFYVSVISQLAGKMFAATEARSLRDRLLKSATGSFSLRIASTGFSFIISVVLARLLGAAGYGTYSYVTGWIALLAVPAMFGLDRLLIREIAVYRTQSAWGLMKGLLRWANMTVLVVSFGLELVAAGLIWIFAEHFDFETSSALWAGLLMLPLVAFVDIRQAAMRGFNHIVVSLLPDFFIRPLTLIALLGCAYLFFGSGLKPQWALGLNAAAVAVALLVATYLLRKMVPQPARGASPAYQTSAWVRSALPMMLISGMNVINNRTDTIMLGTMKTAEVVGIYTVAHRGAQLILLIQTAVNVALAPTIASLHAAGEMQRLQRVVTKSAQVVSLVSLSIALGLILFGDAFLSLFGSEFIKAYPTLAILIAGCIVNTAAGSVGILLVMTGHERDAAMAVGIAVVLNVIFNAALIPHWGAEGAAVATSSSMMAQNLLMMLLVYTRLGIHSTALGRMNLKKHV